MLGEPDLTKDKLIQALKDGSADYNSGTRIVFDKAFMSATPFASGGFDREIDIKIFAPAGTHATYVADHSQHSSERETLFNAGTKFRLLKIVHDGSGWQDKLTLYLEAIVDD